MTVIKYLFRMVSCFDSFIHLYEYNINVNKRNRKIETI